MLEHDLSSLFPHVPFNRCTGITFFSGRPHKKLLTGYLQTEAAKGRRGGGEEFYYFFNGSRCYLSTWDYEPSCSLSSVKRKDVPTVGGRRGYGVLLSLAVEGRAWLGGEAKRPMGPTEGMGVQLDLPILPQDLQLAQEALEGPRPALEFWGPVSRLN